MDKAFIKSELQQAEECIDELGGAATPTDRRTQAIGLMLYEKLAYISEVMAQLKTDLRKI